jgi:hypothetical protein
MLTYKIPTIAGVNPTVGDVLYVDQPAAQQMLVSLFGNSLLTPTYPPPNSSLQTPPPPHITPTTTTSTTTTTLKSSGTAKGTTTTTTTIPTLAVAGSTQATPLYDPVPCSP